MKYRGMPAGMWLLFSRSFEKHLISVLEYDAETAHSVTAKARIRYQEIISRLPEFQKEDRFKLNIVSCAMFSAFLMKMPGKPSVEKATEYYCKSMMTGAMKLFCRISGKNKFTENDIESMQETAALKAADRNPYSWNMEFLPYEDGSGYEARFTHCGICTLMRKLRLSEYIPAMCHFDYTMSNAGGVTDFVREYTLASGGPYCDCGYKKKG